MALINENQTVSAGVYDIAVRNAANLPEDFVHSNQQRIDRAYNAGEPIWMIADELKMIYSLGTKPQRTKSPREMALRIIKVS